MATREFPNEWESIPKEVVADWLDHPCTKLLVELLQEAQKECGTKARFLCVNAKTMQAIDVQASAMSIDAASVAYQQALNLIDKARDHAKS